LSKKDFQDKNITNCLREREKSVLNEIYKNCNNNGATIYIMYYVTTPSYMYVLFIVSVTAKLLLYPTLINLAGSLLTVRFTATLVIANIIHDIDCAEV